MSHHVLMDDSTPGDWSSFIQEFLDEDKREEQKQRELSEFRRELAPDEDEGKQEPREPQGRGFVGRAKDAAGSLVPREAVQRLASLPTPGNLGMVVFALVFFLFALVPVNANGDTRIALIWRVLTGGATIPPGPKRQRAEAAQQVAAANPAPSLPEQLFSDAESALGNFWVDHVL